MNRKRYGLVFHISWVLLLLFHSICSAQPVTIMVSVDSNGVKGADTSSCPSISADGRYVVFQSSVSNLTANNDTNGASDIFVRNRLTGQTTLVSVSVDPSGNTGNGSSYSPSISVDGNFVAFCSQASNLVANDTNNAVDDIFVHDLKSGQTTVVSVDSCGNAGNGYSYSPSISADGRYVAFSSDASNLVPGDTNSTSDIFVRDRQTGRTLMVSVDFSGTEGNGQSYYPSISADGRFVAFSSDASNLVPGDINGAEDVFVRGSLFDFPWAMFLPTIISTKP